MADTMPFFNARVQGGYRLGRTNKKALFIRGGLMLMLPSILLAVANSGEDWYEELPDWDKDSYWHFMIDGEHARIPKPFELGVMFATLPERLFRAAYLQTDDWRKFWKRTYWNFSQQLNLIELPQIIAPIYEDINNIDLFRDAPIESMGEREGRVPSLRYNEHTSATMRELAKIIPGADAMGISPKKLEHLVYGYTGTVGMWALSAVDLATRKLADYPPSPTPRFDDLPFIKSLYRGSIDTPARSSQWVEDVYDGAELYRHLRGSIKALQQSERYEELDAFVAKHEGELDVSKPLERATRILGKIRKDVEAVSRNRDMTPEQKRAEFDRLLEERNKAAKEAVMESRRIKEAQAAK